MGTKFCWGCSKWVAAYSKGNRCLVCIKRIKRMKGRSEARRIQLSGTKSLEYLFKVNEGRSYESHLPDGTAPSPKVAVKQYAPFKKMSVKKVTDEQVRAIRAAPTTADAMRLAESFGLKPSSTHAIRDGTTHADVI